MVWIYLWKKISRLWYENMNIQAGYRMEFGIEKCELLILKKLKKEKNWKEYKTKYQVASR